MKRVAAQILHCSSDKILHNHVIEIDNNGVITDIINLNSQRFETARTQYYNGIITSNVISLKLHLSESEIKNLTAGFQYLDLSNLSTAIPPQESGHLLIDFGTENLNEINRLLKSKQIFISELNIHQFINACCYLPLLILKSSPQIQIGGTTNLYLWEGINLSTGSIISEIRILEI